MKPRKAKKRCPIAMALRAPHLRPKVIKSKKQYSRKGRSKDRPSDVVNHRGLFGALSKADFRPVGGQLYTFGVQIPESPAGHLEGLYGASSPPKRRRVP